MNKHDRNAKKAHERSIRNSLPQRPASPGTLRRRARRAEARGMQPAAVGAGSAPIPSTVEGKVAVGLPTDAGTGTAAVQEAHRRRAEYNQMNMDELKVHARVKNIEGRSKMKKDELIDALVRS